MIVSVSPAFHNKPRNPFLVCLPSSLFCLLLCSCHFSLPLYLSVSLVPHVFLFSSGLTVLPLLNERFANRSLMILVLPLCSVLLSILFVLPAAKLHYTFFFSLSVSLHLRLSVFARGPARQVNGDR